MKRVLTAVLVLGPMTIYAGSHQNPTLKIVEKMLWYDGPNSLSESFKKDQVSTVQSATLKKKEMPWQLKRALSRLEEE